MSGTADDETPSSDDTPPSAAGWLPDRDDPSMLRYWDGSQWSDYRTRSRGEAPSEQVQPSPPGWHTDPQDPTSLRYWDGARWTDQRAPNSNKNESRSTEWSRSRVLAAVGAGLLILGSLMPWVTVTTAFGSISRAGADDDGDGILTLIAGGIALGLVVARKYPPAVIIAALAAAVVLYDWFDISQTANDVNSGFGRLSVGWGLYVTGIGAGLVLFGSIDLWKSARQRKATEEASSAA